jgi:hypothetical protein
MPGCNYSSAYTHNLNRHSQKCRGGGGGIDEEAVEEVEAEQDPVGCTPHTISTVENPVSVKMADGSIIKVEPGTSLTELQTRWGDFVDAVIYNHPHSAEGASSIKSETMGSQTVDEGGMVVELHDDDHGDVGGKREITRDTVMNGGSSISDFRCTKGTCTYVSSYSHNLTRHMSTCKGGSVSVTPAKTVMLPASTLSSPPAPLSSSTPPVSTKRTSSSTTSTSKKDLPKSFKCKKAGCSYVSSYGQNLARHMATCKGGKSQGHSGKSKAGRGSRGRGRGKLEGGGGGDTDSMDILDGDANEDASEGDGDLRTFQDVDDDEGAQVLLSLSKWIPTAPSISGEVKSEVTRTLGFMNDVELGSEGGKTE